MSQEFSNTSNRRYLLLIAVVLMIALVGYGGFIQYMRLPASIAAGSGLILLAIAVGMASLFSPCSFLLLVTLLAGEVVTQSEQSLMRSAAALRWAPCCFYYLLGWFLLLAPVPQFPVSHLPVR